MKTLQFQRNKQQLRKELLAGLVDMKPKKTQYNKSILKSKQKCFVRQDQNSGQKQQSLIGLIIKRKKKNQNQRNIRDQLPYQNRFTNKLNEDIKKRLEGELLYNSAKQKSVDNRKTTYNQQDEGDQVSKDFDKSKNKNQSSLINDKQQKSYFVHAKKLEMQTIQIKQNQPSVTHKNFASQGNKVQIPSFKIDNQYHSLSLQRQIKHKFFSQEQVYIPKSFIPFTISRNMKSKNTNKYCRQEQQNQYQQEKYEHYIQEQKDNDFKQDISKNKVQKLRPNDFVGERQVTKESKIKKIHSKPKRQYMNQKIGKIISQSTQRVNLYNNNENNQACNEAYQDQNLFNVSNQQNFNQTLQFNFSSQSSYVLKSNGGLLKLGGIKQKCSQSKNKNKEFATKRNDLQLIEYMRRVKGCDKSMKMSQIDQYENVPLQESERIQMSENKHKQNQKQHPYPFYLDQPLYQQQQPSLHQQHFRRSSFQQLDQGSAGQQSARQQQPQQSNSNDQKHQKIGKQQSFYEQQNKMIKFTQSKYVQNYQDQSLLSNVSLTPNASIMSLLMSGNEDKRNNQGLTQINRLSTIRKQTQNDRLQLSPSPLRISQIKNDILIKSITNFKEYDKRKQQLQNQRSKPRIKGIIENRREQQDSTVNLNKDQQHQSNQLNQGSQDNFQHIFVKQNDLLPHHNQNRKKHIKTKQNTLKDKTKQINMKSHDDKTKTKITYINTIKMIKDDDKVQQTSGNSKNIQLIKQKSRLSGQQSKLGQKLRQSQLIKNEPQNKDNDQSHNYYREDKSNSQQQNKSHVQNNIGVKQNESKVLNESSVQNELSDFSQEQSLNQADVKNNKCDKFQLSKKENNLKQKQQLSQQDENIKFVKKRNKVTVNQTSQNKGKNEQNYIQAINQPLSSQQIHQNEQTKYNKQQNYIHKLVPYQLPKKQVLQEQSHGPGQIQTQENQEQYSQIQLEQLSDELQDKQQKRQESQQQNEQQFSQYFQFNQFPDWKYGDQRDKKNQADIQQTRKKLSTAKNVHINMINDILSYKDQNNCKGQGKQKTNLNKTQPPQTQTKPDNIRQSNFDIPQSSVIQKQQRKVRILQQIPLSSSSSQGQQALQNHSQLIIPDQTINSTNLKQGRNSNKRQISSLNDIDSDKYVSSSDQDEANSLELTNNNLIKQTPKLKSYLSNHKKGQSALTKTYNKDDPAQHTKLAQKQLVNRNKVKLIKTPLGIKNDKDKELFPVMEQSQESRFVEESLDLKNNSLKTDKRKLKNLDVQPIPRKSFPEEQDEELKLLQKQFTNHLPQANPNYNYGRQFQQEKSQKFKNQESSNFSSSKHQDSSKASQQLSDFTQEQSQNDIQIESIQKILLKKQEDKKIQPKQLTNQISGDKKDRNLGPSEKVTKSSQIKKNNLENLKGINQNQIKQIKKQRNYINQLKNQVSELKKKISTQQKISLPQKLKQKSISQSSGGKSSHLSIRPVSMSSESLSSKQSQVEMYAQKVINELAQLNKLDQKKKLSSEQRQRRYDKYQKPESKQYNKKRNDQNDIQNHPLFDFSDKSSQNQLKSQVVVYSQKNNKNLSSSSGSYVEQQSQQNQVHKAQVLDLFQQFAKQDSKRKISLPRPKEKHDLIPNQNIRSKNKENPSQLGINKNKENPSQLGMNSNKQKKDAIKQTRSQGCLNKTVQNQGKSQETMNFKKKPSKVHLIKQKQQKQKFKQFDEGSSGECKQPPQLVDIPESLYLTSLKNSTNKITAEQVTTNQPKRLKKGISISKKLSSNQGNSSKLSHLQDSSLGSSAGGNGNHDKSEDSIVDSLAKSKQNESLWKFMLKK